MVPPTAAAAGVEPGAREPKKRAAKGTATYAFRDPDKWRVYQRELMRKRRAKR